MQLTEAQSVEGCSGSFWHGWGSVRILKGGGSGGFIFYPLITSHWCHYRRKSTPRYFPPLWFSPSAPLSLWLVYLSICMCSLTPLLPHSPSPSLHVTLTSCVPPFVIFSLLHLPPLSALHALYSTFPTSLSLLSTLFPKPLQTCFWNGFCLWKIPLATQSLRVTKSSKI